MKNYFILILFFTIFYTNAQDVPRDYISLRDELKVHSGVIENNQLAGSPFINEEFLPGRIIVDEKQYQEVYLRFNALKEVMEIKVRLGDQEVFLLPRTEKYTYVQNDKTFFIKDFITEDGEVLSGYWINYFQNPNILFMGKPVTKTTAAKAAETGYEKFKPAKVDTYVHYYLSLNNSPLKRVQLRQRDFKRIFQSQRMKEYFSNNKMKEVEDVVEMLKYYSLEI
jgi:hypothetical protein